MSEAQFTGRRAGTSFTTLSSPKYDWPRILKEAFERLEGGETLTQLFPYKAGDPKFPEGTPTLMAVLLNIPKHDFSDIYDSYKVLQAEIVAQKLDKLLADIETGDVDFRAGRVLMDGFSRRMGQLNRQLYNDKVAKVDVSGKIEHSVTSTLSKALERAEARDQPKVIEGNVTLVEETADDDPFG